MRRSFRRKPEYVLDTSEFDSVKARLAVLENRHKIQEEKDTNRPTLRRTSSGDSTTSGKRKRQQHEQ